MRGEGFDVSARLDPASGLVFGGNAHNCGTWMDKMGSAAANAGEPATPRDGCAVEIAGLVYSCVRWLAGLAAEAAEAAAAEQAVSSSEPAAAAAVTSTVSEAPVFAFAGVELGVPGGGGGYGSHGGGGEGGGHSATFLSYAEWAARLRSGFERRFWVPLRASEDSSFCTNSALANVRGIYRDTAGASAEWADYQLRPNFAIAMAVAPELFDARRASHALAVYEARLLGRLGVKTLDAADWAFRAEYSADAQGEKATAGGWNYHQGPEWVWPLGYFLRARLLFPPNEGVGVDGDGLGPTPARGWPSGASARRWVYAKLAAHRRHVEDSQEGALPELENAGGSFCRASCRVQAWSGATLLDALYDVHLLEDADAEGEAARGW
jgi:glycogen debranching enzyme